MLRSNYFALVRSKFVLQDGVVVRGPFPAAIDKFVAIQVTGETVTWPAGVLAIKKDGPPAGWVHLCKLVARAMRGASGRREIIISRIFNQQSLAADGRPRCVHPSPERYALRSLR